MKIKLVIGVMVVVGLTEISALAGGAAVRRQGNIRVKETIKVSPPPRWPVQAPDPTTVKEEKPAAPAVAPTPSPVKAAAAPPRTLVSSPFYSGPISAAPTPYTETTLEDQLVMLIRRLDRSSEIWPRIPDMRIKMLLVSRYVDLYRRQGVIIGKPALVYANLITAMGRDKPALLRRPFPDVLRDVAILEYDFANGQNKDDLARGLLGPQAYVENKQRLNARSGF